MGTGAGMNLLFNPLPKERHPAALPPFPPNTSSPPTRDLPTASRPASTRAGVSVGPRQRDPGVVVPPRPPPRSGCSQPHEGAAAPRRGAQRSAARGNPAASGVRSGAPHIVLLCSTPLPTRGPGTSTPCPAPSALRGAGVGTRMAPASQIWAHLAAQLQSWVGKNPVGEDFLVPTSPP